MEVKAILESSKCLFVVVVVFCYENISITEVTSEGAAILSSDPE